MTSVPADILQQLIQATGELAQTLDTLDISDPRLPDRLRTFSTSAQALTATLQSGTLHQTLAHDLRNHVAAITAGIAILSRPNAKPEFIAHVQEALPRQLGQMRQLLERLSHAQDSQRHPLSL